MPLSGWANYLVPLFHCSRNPQGVFVQAPQSWASSYYLGIGIVALALVAVWRARNKRVLFLTVVALFSLIMALGSKGRAYDAFKHLLPLVGFIRFPVKFLFLATFAIPLLAAFGLNWLQAVPAKSWPREWTRVKLLALGLIVLVAAIVWRAWNHPLPGDNATVTAVNASIRILFLVLTFGCVALLRRTADAKLQKFLQPALIALLWFDVHTHAGDLSPTVASAALKPDAIRQHFDWDNQLRAGGSRAMQSKAALWEMLSAGSPSPELDTALRRRALMFNLNLLDHVPKFDGFYSLDIKEHLEVFKRVYFTTNEAAPLKNFLGVSRVSNPTNVVDWVSRSSFLPMITAGQKPVFADDARTLEHIISAQFDPARTVYLPLELQGAVAARDETRARILSARFSTHRLQMEVEADAPAMVVVAQTFYHPWHAYVDGKSAPLWRANHAFQALEIPSGRHQVTLVYEDRAFIAGAVLSACSLLVFALLWLRWRRDKVQKAA